MLKFKSWTTNLEIRIKNFPTRLTVKPYRGDVIGTYVKRMFNLFGTIETFVDPEINLDGYFRCLQLGTVPIGFSYEHVMELKRVFDHLPVHDEKGKYIPLDFSTQEELEARRKEPVMIKFGEYTIPKAIYRKMKLFKHMEEDVGEITVSYPEHLQPYVHDAINKIMWIPSAADYTIEDMAVYDFLEMLDVFDCKLYFIYGDELLSYNIPNLLRTGLPPVGGHQFVFDQIITGGKELVTDSIVETHFNYRYIRDLLVRERVGFGKGSYIDFRTLKLLGTRGHL